MKRLRIVLEVDADEPLADDLREAVQQGGPRIIWLSNKPTVISVEEVE